MGAFSGAGSSGTGVGVLAKLIDCLGSWAQAETVETPISESPVRRDRRETANDIQYTFKRREIQAVAKRLLTPPHRVL
ncbi:hypothetical protein EOA30_37895 [Mesorhizobium sp. M8A.F.Ca.ET.059.01.1.1]|nr:hypothetical protein EOA30_37895 [Mesorhizobium sp. M8A.F.Ca.ET.059.01.1.1]